jgi:uncharacterized protein
MLRLIKDPVVGNSVLSEIEAGILEMPVVNRLHALMQNGLAYRVFPSDTTSRFEHSIGVMHLSGEMYCRGMANALPRTRDRFLLKAWRTVLAPAKGIRDGSDPLLAEAARLPEVIAELLSPEFLNHHPGPALSCRVPHLQAAHSLLLQAVRLAGLLHDVGHFPCSHLFEDALRLLKCHGLPPDINQHLEKIRGFAADLAPSLKDAALHEQAGFLIARAILYERLAKGGRTTAIKDAVAKRLVLAALRILGHKENPSPSGTIIGALSELLCGDLDADRLDFVLRDGRRTGLVTASGDVDRILKMICLTESEKGFRFCPAIQTLNDVQQCLLDRLRLYQYVYSHHRVWRLENMLKYGLRITMKYPCPEREALSALFADLESLGGELKPALLSATLIRISRRTDHWLLDLVQNARDSVMTPEERDRTEELFSGPKNWTSLWKREFEYRAFLIQSARQWIEADAKLVEKIYCFLLSTAKNQKNNAVEESGRDIVALAALKERDSAVMDENSVAWLGSLIVRTILARAESNLVCRHNIPNVMICPTRFHSGVRNLCLVDIKSIQRSCLSFAVLSTDMRYFEEICERGIAMHIFARKESDRSAVMKEVALFIYQILQTMLSKAAESGLIVEHKTEL